MYAKSLTTLCLAVLSGTCASSHGRSPTLYTVESLGGQPDQEQFRLATIEPSNADYAVVSPNVVHSGVTSLAYDWERGIAYGFETIDDTLFRLNLKTGEIFPVGPTIQVGGLAFDQQSDSLVGIANGSLYRIDPLTGASVRIQENAHLRNTLSLAISPLTGELFTTAIALAPRGTHLINLTTGAIVSESRGAIGMDFDPASGVLYATRPLPGFEGAEIFTIDTLTGAETLIGITQGQFGNSLMFAPRVPSPASLAQVAIALLILAKRGARRGRGLPRLC